MSSTSRAVICTEKGQAAVKDVPVPSVREGYVLVKVKAVALNPTDWKSIHSGGATGTKIGVCIIHTCYAHCSLPCEFCRHRGS